MSEWGCQALLSDEVWANPELRERARSLMAQAFKAKGLPGVAIHYEEYRHYSPPSHDNSEFTDCPYAVFDSDHPGADADEFPECGNDAHWLGGQWLNELMAWCEVPDELAS